MSTTAVAERLTVLTMSEYVLRGLGLVLVVTYDAAILIGLPAPYGPVCFLVSLAITALVLWNIGAFDVLKPMKIADVYCVATPQGANIVIASIRDRKKDISYRLDNLREFTDWMSKNRVTHYVMH